MTGESATTNGHGARRVLVVADEAVVGAELRDRLMEHLGDGTGSVFVVAPALVDSGLKHTLGDVDDAIAPAGERLQRTLDELRGAGIEADGEVGDSDPMVAIQDEIQKFHPDQVLLVAHGAADSAFAERGLLEQAQRDLDLPVVELVVDRAESPHVLDVKETDSVAGRRKGWRPSRNWPPLSRRDMGGIFVAVLGTLILGALAADCVGEASGHDFEEGRLGFACAATILIAMFMALINLAHVVGLFLFQSVGYEGIWNRFFARLSLFGTPTALLAAVLLRVF
ncbi:MAG TPA: hypothetical protein VF729_05030 [Solirubrobacterales bacterium]